MNPGPASCSSNILKTFGTGVEHGLSKRQDASLEEIAADFVASKLNIGTDKIRFRSGFEGEVTKNAYVKQTFVRPVLSLPIHHAHNKAGRCSFRKRSCECCPE